MNGIRICSVGNAPALTYACQYLNERGFQILTKPEADATHLLLPTPAFQPDRRIRGGGILEHILPDLPGSVCVVGGNLDHPALAGYGLMDLLRDPYYLAQNAAITAHCALRIAGENLPVTFHDCRVLILGWGRIGKCLANLLKTGGVSVTVAARKASDRAELTSLGYACTDYPQLPRLLPHFRLIINTVPHPVINSQLAELCSDNCVKLDLASQKGIEAEDVIWARGLPGKMAPESSGRLIAQTFIRLMMEKEYAS